MNQKFLPTSILRYVVANAGMGRNRVNIWNFLISNIILEINMGLRYILRQIFTIVTVTEVPKLLIQQ